MIWQGNNINHINDCDVINAFVAKLELDIVEFKNENSSKLDIALEKNPIKLGQA